MAPLNGTFLERDKTGQNGTQQERKLYLKRKRNLSNVVGKAGMSKLITHSHNDRQPC